MPHPLVEQLRFARNEWRRALAGVTDEEARRRLAPMNCLSWMIAHLAWQEQRYWLWSGQGTTLIPEIDALAGYGRPASTPPLDEAWAMWQRVTAAADPFLDTLTTQALQVPTTGSGKPWPETPGTQLRRTTYHYFYHIGEAQAIRQLLGHTHLPDFVGDLGDAAPYRPEPGAEHREVRAVAGGAA